MATNNAINTGDSERVFTGVATWTGSGAYFDDTTLGSFTVSRGGTGYIKGKPITWAGAQTVTGLTAGSCWFIYIDSTGTIGKSASRDTVFDNGDYICLFECLRDSTSPTNNQVTVREDHPYTMAYGTCEYLHDSIGTIIENHSNGANVVLKDTKKIQISGADVLMDHGLETTIPDSAGAAVSFHKKFTNNAGKWCWQNTSDEFTGWYNNAGTPTVLGATKFGVYTLYVSKDTKTASTPTYFAVLDNAQYNTQGAASTAIGNGSTAKATNELLELELCQLGYIIFGQAADAIVQVIISKKTFQSSVTTTGTNAASLINTSTTNFDGILSSADTNVQAALETIDDWGKTTTNYSLLLGNGTGVAIGSLGVATNGQLPIGSSGADPVLATITAGSGISVTNGAGTISLATSAGGMAVVDCTASNTVAMAVNTTYIATSTDGSTLVTFTLPATSAIGDTIEVVGASTGLWRVNQNSGNTICMGAATTTPGATGYVSLTAGKTYASIKLRCITANANWVIASFAENAPVLN